MGLKDQISAEQWKVLLNAPSAAAEYVATASGGGLEVIKEVFTSIRAVQETAFRTDGSGFGTLVDGILAEMKEMTFSEAKEDTVRYESKDLASLREEAKGVVVSAGTAAAALDGGDGYKRWLLFIARKVAETKTGGVLGFGGTSVIDEKEEAALAELKTLLGVVEM
jgi:hypothetical protein